MKLNEIIMPWYDKIFSDKEPRQIRSIHNIYQLYKWIVVIPLLCLSTVVLTIFAMPVIWLFGQRAGQISGILWARFNSFITPMHITVEGAENVVPGQSYVVVANHQSQYDIFAIYGWIPVDFRWVMKAELRKVPVLGYYCEIAGHIYINRTNHESALQSINSIKERISGGTSILFFPEGTRSLTGEVNQFKKGAFVFALENDLPILPVTISGTRNILPPKTMDLFPGNASLIIHKPVDASGHDENTIERLAEQVRNTIRSGLSA